MKKLDLGENDFDDEVAIDFDDALANNTALNTLTRWYGFSDRIWNALSVSLDKSSIEKTYTSSAQTKFLNFSWVLSSWSFFRFSMSLSSMIFCQQSWWNDRCDWSAGTEAFRYLPESWAGCLWRCLESGAQKKGLHCRVEEVLRGFPMRYRCSENVSGEQTFSEWWTLRKLG